MDKCLRCRRTDIQTERVKLTPRYDKPSIYTDLCEDCLKKLEEVLRGFGNATNEMLLVAWREGFKAETS